jgi:glyoxylase-like metal-dependent hydrolase (beta-lactamase superfamily II)
MNPIAIHAHNPGPYTGEGNWTWLLRGRVPTLIDAGSGEAAHLEAVAQALDGETLTQVLVTHAHGDHASGAPALAARFPHAVFRKMPWAGRDQKWPVNWQPLGDGDRIVAGDETLVAVHTPGHAPDHLAFWHEPTRTLFGGDLAVKGTTIFIPSNHQGDLSDYLASLDRVLALAPARLLPAHGPIVDDPRVVIAGYIAHRLFRERQVEAALRAGRTTVEAIAESIYDGLAPALMPAARENVRAHLEKLEDEGRASEAGGHWQP